MSAVSSFGCLDPSVLILHMGRILMGYGLEMDACKCLQVNLFSTPPFSL